MLLRPCFLVVDHEFAGNISTRKLLLETAKFNVITAYSYPEGRAALERFPRLHGVVLTADGTGEAEAFLQFVREQYPEMKRVLTGEQPDGHSADVRVQSFAPDKLLAALRDLFPVASTSLEKRETYLERKAGEAEQDESSQSQKPG